MPASDEQLIGQALTGRMQSYDALMQRYQRQVYRLAWGFCRNREDAMDLTQEVFLKVYRGLQSLDRRAGLKPWLMRIAANEGVNWLRRQRRRAPEVHAGELPEPVAAARQHRDVMTGERSQQVRRAMDRLNERQRLALELRYFRELPIRDVAAALDCTEGTAKSILFRGIQRLRESVSWREERGHRRA